MWILQFLPDWLFYAILLGGIFGLVLNKFIPGIYRVPVLAGSVGAVVIGLFMAGAIHERQTWLDRVTEMEAKVAKAEQDAKDATAQVDAKVEAQKTKIKEKQVFIKQYITQEVTKYDTQCVIPKEFIEVHNKAAVK